MEEKMLLQAETYVKKNHRRRLWKKIVSAMACIVVFCTVYALILPAVTMENPLICGMEEHSHEEACYETMLMEQFMSAVICQPEIHQHTAECFDDEGDEGKLICGLADQVIHIHDANCFDADGLLICNLPETMEHIHDDRCFSMETTMKCAVEEDYHLHDETCFQTAQGELICQPEDPENHEHSDACYEQTVEVICGVSENPDGHLHGEDCYETMRILSCQLEQIAVHTHDEFCVDENGLWNCGILAACDHQHTAECLEVIPAAPVEQQELVCQLAVHAHAAECYPEMPGLGPDVLPEETDGETDEVPDDRVPDPDEVFGNPTEGSEDLEEPAADQEEIRDDVESSFDAVADLVMDEPDSVQAFATFGRFNTMAAASPTTYTTRDLISTGTIDMAPLIDSVTVYRKQNGAWVAVPSGGTITQGEDLKFTIDYTVVGYTLSAEKNTLVYKIPDNITQIRSSAGAVYNTDKNAAGVREEVGRYQVDAATNTIYIIFSDEYVKNNQLNKAIDASISFNATVENIGTEGDEKEDILFSDKVQIEMEVVEKEDIKGDLDIQKSIASVNGTELTYEIVVSSKTGTFSSVTLTDEMTGGMKMSGSVKVKDKNGNTLFDNSYSPMDSGFAMTLPQMNAGDVYTLTYTAELSGTVSGHQLVNNKAVVNSTDDTNSPINDFAEVDHNFKVLNKSGKWQEDGSIQWTIVINEDKADISGAVLSDKITDGGVEVVFNGPVTITNSSGSSWEVGLPYTFPQGSNDTYTITYTTSDHVLSTNGVTNWAGLELQDKNVVFGDEEGVNPGEVYPVYKSGETVSPKGAIPIINRWTTTVNITSGSVPAGSYIQDLMSDQYMTSQQILDMYANAEKAMEPLGLHIEKIYARGYDENFYDYAEVAEAPDMKFYSFLLYIKEEIPKGTTFSFSYETTAEGAPETGYFYNHVRINELNWHNAVIQYKTDNPSITKFGVDPRNLDQLLFYDTTLDYDELHEENGEKTLWWKLQLQIPLSYKDANTPIVIEDILPEGLELAYSIVRPWQSAGEEDQKILYPDEDGYAQCMWWLTDQTMDMRITAGDKDNQIITYTVSGAVTSMLANNVIDIYVVCTFRDDFDWGETGDAIVQVPFTNTVSVKSPNGEVFEVKDHNYLINYDQSHEIVSKFGTMNEWNELEYSVVLNEKARNLDPDEATLKVKDVLTYDSPGLCPVKLYLKPGSVKVYDYTGGVKGALITTARYTYTESAVGKGDISYTHTLDLVLPDSQAMLLEYVYTVDGAYNENYSYDMVNVCTITGVASGGLQDATEIEVKVYDIEAEAGFNGVYIYKVDSFDNKLYLPGAVFNLYTWNQHDGKYVRVKHPDTDGKSEEHYAFTTDQSGYLVLNDETMGSVAYNTAYYITEVVAPSGYFKDPNPYYFYIHNSNTEQNPYNFPDGFKGDRLPTGALIYYYNESATTEIAVRKKWLDHNNNPITVTGEQVNSISFELWQKLDGVEGSDKLYGTYTVTPDENGFWELTVTDLPKGIKNPKNGTKGTLYLYDIKEVNVRNYEASYEYDDGDDTTTNDAGGINSGTITITNRELVGYVLPETGGVGTQLYTMGGLLMITASSLLLYRNKKRRKEEHPSF